MAEDPLNKDYFFPPKLAETELRVRGFDRHGVKNGGMTRFNRIHLDVGQTYYRFCDRARYLNAATRQQAIEGAWWADYERFKRISQTARLGSVRKFARDKGEPPLSYAAKLHFALPYEWGDCGMVIEAQLVRRLDAFIGWGDTATLSKDLTKRDPRDGGAKYIPHGTTPDPANPRNEMYQLYIPGLGEHFATAFKIRREIDAFSAL